MATEHQDMERRFLPVAIGAVSMETREDGQTPTIKGVAAVFYDGTPDTEYQLWTDTVERIMPGAFDGVLKRNDDARALYNHNPDHLLGRRSAGTLRLRRQADGLHYYIDPPDTQMGKDVAALVARGDLSGSSFGFRVLTENWRTEDGKEVREIEDLELFDVGPVTYPAYEGTSVSLRARDMATKRRQTDNRRHVRLRLTETD